MIAMGCLGLLSGAPVWAGELAVIANANGPVKLDDVRAIFLGEKRFEGSVKLIPVNAADEAQKAVFLEAVVKMSAKDYKTHWTKKVFQDGLTAPIAKATAKEIVDFVAKEAGAVGYVPKEAADNAPGIKTLTTVAPPTP